MTYDIAIVGAGASGLVAAIRLAQKGFKVVVIEQKPRIGQKILVTGNGRCNLTNLDIKPSNYHSQTPEIVNQIISKYDSGYVIDFFASIGLLTKNKDNLVYPLSNKASSVLDCLINAVSKYKIDVFTDFSINDIAQIEQKVKAKKLIIATGQAECGLNILKNLGHRIKKPYPALVQLRSDDLFIKGLKGVKVNCKIKAVQSNTNKILREEKGEMLFTDYGISGIAVMQLSYLFSLYDNLHIEVDFIPDVPYKELEKVLELNIELNLTGIVDKKLGTRILKYSQNSHKKIVQNLKSCIIKISGHNGIKNAQVCGGGALLNEFNTNSLESIHAGNVYAVGEVLDAVGDCGGYNLHWAWATAMLVGDSL